jgi:CDP-diacylglycerol--serine O-phosphatidyltransferase
VKPTGFLRTAIRALPTTITMGALVSGMMSVFASLQGLEAGADPVSSHLRAALLIMLAMILDGLDGNVARLLNATSAIGGELDTFVDLTAFGIAPALLIYVTAEGFAPVLRLTLGCALVASGAYRLSRFKAVDPYRGQHGFMGLPITVCAAFVALFHIVSNQAPESWGFLKLNLREGPIAGAVLGFVTLLAVLQVSRFHFPKPTKNPLFFIPSIGGVILLFSGRPALAAASALVGILFGFYFVFVTPFLNRPPVQEPRE